MCAFTSAWLTRTVLDLWQIVTSRLFGGPPPSADAVPASPIVIAAVMTAKNIFMRPPWVVGYKNTNATSP